MPHTPLTLESNVHPDWLESYSAGHQRWRLWTGSSLRPTEGALTYEISRTRSLTAGGRAVWLYWFQLQRWLWTDDARRVIDFAELRGRMAAGRAEALLPIGSDDVFWRIRALTYALAALPTDRATLRQINVRARLPWIEAYWTQLDAVAGRVSYVRQAAGPGAKKRPRRK